MLNRTLATIFCRKGQLCPAFVDTRRPDCLMLAEQLLGIYRSAAEAKQPFAEVDDMAQAIVNGAQNRRMALALRKLLEERCTFSNQSGLDFQALRAPVFAAAAKLLRSAEELPSIQEYQRLLVERVGSNPLLDAGQLYGDLPDNDQLLEFKELNATQLLERYNLGLVQALLLEADCMEAVVATADAPRLRRLFMYLRFFNLLAKVKADEMPAAGEASGKMMRLRMVIDGPASILEHSRQYGVKLAAFFPVLCTMEEWQLEAQVMWKEHPALLRLDQSSGLKCQYHNFAAYVPDEVRLFREHFEETVPEWKLVGETPFLRGEGSELIVPDFSFRNDDGLVVHLELFNRWHANGVEERLTWLERHPEVPMVLGVDLTLLRKPEIADRLEASEWFARRGFTYRDYPTCGKVKKALKGF